MKNTNTSFSRIFISCLALFLMLGSCNSGPKKIVVGKDECFSCKMKITDPKFGSEIVTTKGKVLIFDDIGCMISYEKSGEIEAESIKNRFVVSYIPQADFLKVEEATFIVSDEIHSPMHSGVAALSSSSEASILSEKFNGRILDWSALQSEIE